jgi:hypothetical protein
MDSWFVLLDACLLWFSVLIAATVIIIVSLGQLPGQLTRKWGHPQAVAIAATRWIGIAGGLLRPVAFIWVAPY